MSQAGVNIAIFTGVGIGALVVSIDLIGKILEKGRKKKRRR